MLVEDGFDRRPTFVLSPIGYERAVADIVKVAGHDVIDWQVEHLDPIEGMDGTYVIYVTRWFTRNPVPAGGRDRADQAPRWLRW